MPAWQILTGKDLLQKMPCLLERIGILPTTKNAIKMFANATLPRERSLDNITIIKRGRVWAN